MRPLVVTVLIFASILLVLASAAFFMFVDTRPMGRLEYLGLMGRITAFKFTGVPELDEAETRFLYNNSCTRRCHGRDVVERTKHTPREWEAVVNRMRLVNGARLTDKEAVTIMRYLQKNFSSNVPTILSDKANRFLKQYLWKSDFGESDLYIDVIYTPLEYFKLLGGAVEAEKYDVEDYAVFLVYLNTHQGRLKQFPMERLAVLKDKDGRSYEPFDWQVIYEGGDLHHREGVLRFKRVKDDKGFLELTLKDLPGQRERLFRWELPIPEAPETL